MKINESKIIVRELDMIYEHKSIPDKKLENFTYCDTDKEIKYYFEKWNKEIEKYKNTLILDMFSVYRLIKIVYEEDEEVIPGDFYYLVENGQGENELLTVIVKNIMLKSSLKKKDYETLLYFWNLNHETQAE